MKTSNKENAYWKGKPSKLAVLAVNAFISLKKHKCCNHMYLPVGANVQSTTECVSAVNR